MGFAERVRQIEIESATCCAVCRDDFPPDSYVEVHSATSLHLVFDAEKAKFIVTDPPKGHESLKGKALDPKLFANFEGKQSDGFCLCPVCHDEIHRVALTEAQQVILNFTGNTPPPQILEDVTLFFVERGRCIVY